MTDLNKLLTQKSPFKENNKLKKQGGKPPLAELQLTDCEEDELDQSAETTGIN